MMSASNSIFFHAVYLFDHGLQSLQGRFVTPDELAALAHVAFILAAKFDQGDIQLPLSPLEMNAEQYLFGKLGYNLIVPNVFIMIRFISWEYAGGCEKMRLFARILVTAAVHDCNYTNYGPLDLAASAMLLASDACHQPIQIPADMVPNNHQEIKSFLTECYKRYKASLLLLKLPTIAL